MIRCLSNGLTWTTLPVPSGKDLGEARACSALREGADFEGLKRRPLKERNVWTIHIMNIFVIGCCGTKSISKTTANHPHLTARCLFGNKGISMAGFREPNNFERSVWFSSILGPGLEVVSLVATCFQRTGCCIIG